MAAMASCELASGDLGNPWLDELPGVFAGAFLRHNRWRTGTHRPKDPKAFYLMKIR